MLPKVADLVPLGGNSKVHWKNFNYRGGDFKNMEKQNSELGLLAEILLQKFSERNRKSSRGSPDVCDNDN